MNEQQKATLYSISSFLFAIAIGDYGKYEFSFVQTMAKHHLNNMKNAELGDVSDGLIKLIGENIENY